MTALLTIFCTDVIFFLVISSLSGLLGVSYLLSWINGVVEELPFSHCAWVSVTLIYLQIAGALSVELLIRLYSLHFDTGSSYRELALSTRDSPWYHVAGITLHWLLCTHGCIVFCHPIPLNPSHLDSENRKHAVRCRRASFEPIGRDPPGRSIYSRVYAY